MTAKHQCQPLCYSQAPHNLDLYTYHLVYRSFARDTQKGGLLQSLWRCRILASLLMSLEVWRCRPWGARACNDLKIAAAGRRCPLPTEQGVPGRRLLSCLG